MKKLINNLSLILVILKLFSLSSCRLSTDELAEEVKTSVQETWKKEGLSGIQIESLRLIHKGGNEYSGILETNIYGEKNRYNVDVIYDGENMKWEIVK